MQGQRWRSRAQYTICDSVHEKWLSTFRSKARTSLPERNRCLRTVSTSGCELCGLWIELQLWFKWDKKKSHLLKWINYIFSFILSVPPLQSSPHAYFISSSLFLSQTHWHWVFSWSRILNTHSSPMCTPLNTSDHTQPICFTSPQLIKLTSVVSIHEGEAAKILIFPLAVFEMWGAALNCQENIFIRLIYHFSKQSSSQAF